MDWDLYKKIVDEVSQYPGTIFRLLGDGEPLCNPKFVDMLAYAKEKNISPVNFITNGLLLNETKASAILKTGIEAVEISLDAINKDTYEKIRRGSNYDTVMRNAHNFIKLRDQLKAKTKILVSIIQQRESENEYDDFVAYWTHRVDKVISRVYTSIGGLVDTSKIKIDNKGDRWPCPQLWRRLFINVDGLAEFCVEDWHDKTIVGDLNGASIKDVWSSSEYEKIRNCHLAEKFDEVPYCDQCLDWKARDWNYNYFHALNEVLGDSKKSLEE